MYDIFQFYDTKIIIIYIDNNNNNHTNDGDHSIITNQILDLEKRFNKDKGGLQNVECSIRWYCRAGSKMIYNGHSHEYKYTGGFGNVNVQSIDGEWHEAFFVVKNLKPIINLIEVNLPVANSNCCVKQFYTDKKANIHEGLKVIVSMMVHYHSQKGVCLKCTSVSLLNGNSFIKQYTKCGLGTHDRTGQLIMNTRQ